MPFHSRASVSVIFFINGVVLASWVPLIPAVKARHAISNGALGIVMTSVAAIALCLALPLPLLSPSVLLLSLSLFVLGACNATPDVSMHAQAVAVERGYGRAIMSSFHGLFSLAVSSGADTIRSSRRRRRSATP